MEEKTEQLTTTAAGGHAPAADPDKTLVHPRFGAREALTAQPVVPLAEPPARGGWRRGGSSLPFMIILASAVVGGLVSVLAYRAYQRRPAQPAPQEARQQQPQQQTPVEEAAVKASPTPELLVVAAQPAEQQPAAEAPDTNVAEAATPDAARVGREERAPVKEDRKPEAAPERAPRRTDDGAKPERTSETPRARRVDAINGPVGERVSQRERPRDDSEIEGEATDYEASTERRARRRAARRAGRRNVDRVRAIFEGDPPRLD